MQLFRLRRICDALETMLQLQQQHQRQQEDMDSLRYFGRRTLYSLKWTALRSLDCLRYIFTSVIGLWAASGRTFIEKQS
jgi:hypothetical protein